jgi:hypothetical protein
MIIKSFGQKEPSRDNCGTFWVTQNCSYIQNDSYVEEIRGFSYLYFFQQYLEYYN